MNTFICDGCGMSYEMDEGTFMGYDENGDDVALCPECLEVWEGMEARAKDDDAT